MRDILSSEIINEYVESQGYKLLSPFINSRTRIKLRCPNEHEYETHFDSFKNKGSRCQKCKGLRRFTIEEIRQYIEFDSGSNYKLLSNEYKNNKTKLTLKCDKGHVFDMQYSVFKNQNGRCGKCANERTRQRLTYTYEYVKSYIEIESKSGFTLIEDKYVNSETKMKMLCGNGHESEKTFAGFVAGKRCWTCHIENNRGESHYSWNPNLTEEDRINRRFIEGYSDWGYSVFERDNYTCQCCGIESSGEMNAHHLDGYNWCKARRLDVSNGATLCGDCHTRFHQMYGYGDNTEDQFLYWIIQYGIGIYNIEEKRKESVLKIRPEPKEPYDAKVYFRKYYEDNSRRYSEVDFDVIFDELITENKHPKYFTMTGFKRLTGINSISVTGVFNMPWIDVLNRYNIKSEVYRYVCDEYLNNYLLNYSCSFEHFTKNHEYITQDLIKQFTMSQIKEDCGFKGSFQQHNFKGFESNFTNIKNSLGRIPLLKEFTNLTKISVPSYFNYFNTTSYDAIIVNFVTSKIELDQFEKDKRERIKSIAAIGGKSGGYSEEEKETEFRRVFDNFYNSNGRYPTIREFKESSKFSEKAYMKKYKISWSQAVEKYGYPTNKSRARINKENTKSVS